MRNVLQVAHAGSAAEPGQAERRLDAAVVNGMRGSSESTQQPVSAETDSATCYHCHRFFDAVTACGFQAIVLRISKLRQAIPVLPLFRR